MRLSPKEIIVAVTHLENREEELIKKLEELEETCIEQQEQIENLKSALCEAKAELESLRDDKDYRYKDGRYREGFRGYN